MEQEKSNPGTRLSGSSSAPAILKRSLVESHREHGNFDDTKTDLELLVDVMDQCSQKGVNVIVDLCNSLDRRTVILMNPEFVEVLFDLAWKKTKIQTFYLFSESDEVLQGAIGKVVKKCSGKLFFRLFSRRLLENDAGQESILSGWIQAIAPDDRSPPFRRLMVLPFRLGRLSKDERELFLEKARHEVADMVIFERLGLKMLRVEEWAALFRKHSGIPSERAVVYSSDGQAFGMVVRFHHQSEQSERLFMRKGTSENNIANMTRLL